MSPQIELLQIRPPQHRPRISINLEAGIVVCIPEIYAIKLVDGTNKHHNTTVSGECGGKPRYSLKFSSCPSPLCKVPGKKQFFWTWK